MYYEHALTPGPSPGKLLQKGSTEKGVLNLRMLSIPRVGEKGEKLHVIGHNQ
jgi:hypothetical protein